MALKVKESSKPKKIEDLFDRVIREAQNADVYRERTQQSIKWYISIVRKLTGPQIRREAFTKRDRFKPTLQFGSMYCFIYDAKTKKDLPYWDRFPLIFPISPTSDGFYGLNLHYIPFQHRARILATLYRVMNNKRYDQSTRVKMSYEYLQSLPALNKTLAMIAFKQYLSARVKSRFIYIAPDEWPIALYLPMEDWQKKSGAAVYADINKQILNSKNK